MNNTKNIKDKKILEDINEIIAEFEIREKEINVNIRIINSYTEWKKLFDLGEKYGYKYENEEEIKNNYKIKINDTLIPFHYFYRFKKQGKYKIQYLF